MSEAAWMRPGRSRLEAGAPSASEVVGTHNALPTSRFKPPLPVRESALVAATPPLIEMNAGPRTRRSGGSAVVKDQAKGSFASR